jgi:sec-independent protein translocase protein TatB
MFLEGKTLELMIAAVVALVVVGPKDLPILLRRFGQFMAKLRGMAAEFRASFDEMARQSELDELRKEVEALRKGQLAEIAAGAQSAEMSQTFDEIHQGLADVGVQLHPPMSHQYSPPPEPAPLPQTTITAAEPAAKPKAKPRAKSAKAKPAPAKTTTAKKTAGAKPAAKPRAKTAGPKS